MIRSFLARQVGKLYEALTGTKPAPATRRPGLVRRAVGRAFLAGFAYVTPETQRLASLQEALSGTLLGNYGADSDTELRGFRTLSQRTKMLRDLDELSQQEMLRMSVRLYAQNNLGRWLVDNTVALCVGQGIGYTITVDHAKAGKSEEWAVDLQAQIREVLDLFWKHPAQRLDQRAGKFIATYLVAGELLLPVAKVNEVNGVPELDYLDSALLKKVLPLNGSSMVPGVAVYSKLGEGGEDNLDLIHENPQTRLLEGKAFFFARTPLLNSMRGVSYLMDVADWTDSRDQLLWAAIDKAILANHLVWDVKMEGATPTQIEDERAKLAREGAFTKPGSHYVHNDQTTLEAVRAEVQAGETVDMLRAIRLDVLGSKGKPESWYAEGGNANRATAGEQTDVSYRAHADLQADFRAIFATLLRFGYEQAQAKNRNLPVLSESPWLTIEPELPVLSERDAQRMTTAAASLEAALEGAIAQALVSKETARKVFLAVLGKIADMPIAVDEEKNLIEAETEEREAAALEKSNELVRKALGDDPEEPQPPLPKEKAEVSA